ncbi:MAG TPA: serine hydrolase domain-containing protein, partial [Saprospiraceae bacterium]|nr:serine hydrolase domain-containing protein [Saprospiraceae bacterium]
MCVWSLSPVFTQVPTAALDALLSAHFSPDRPGGAVLVAQRGQVVYRKAFGLADMSKHMALEPGHIFRVGSLTKQFTAAAILQLAEQGRLSVKDTIGKYITGYPTQGKTIRIEHLLTHTSGIRNYTDMERWDAEFRKKNLTVPELVDFFKNEPMDFDPDMEWKYSNSGYILLGYIIEQVTGKPYERYLRERIFRPLGMNNTYLGTAEDTLRRRALGYTESETDSTLILPAKPLSMTQPYAAGAMLSTVDDLYTWTKALHSGRVVSAQNMKHLLYPYYLPSGKSAHYAYGLVPRLLLGSFTSEHGG